MKTDAGRHFFRKICWFFRNSVKIFLTFPAFYFFVPLNGYIFAPLFKKEPIFLLNF